MTVITAVKKRIPTRMILWDGTAQCAEEIRAFVGRDAPGGAPNFRILNEAAEVFDKLHPTWIPVPIGSYVVEGVDGENYPLDGAVFARTYDVIPGPGTASEPAGLDALIEALTIFRRYGNLSSPTFCGHDVLYVCTGYSTVSDEDKARLDALGFFHNAADDGFMSFDFGSA